MTHLLSVCRPADTSLGGDVGDGSAVNHYPTGVRCRWCGKPAEDDQELCTSCAAKAEEMELKVPDEVEASRTS